LLQGRFRLAPRNPFLAREPAQAVMEGCGLLIGTFLRIELTKLQSRGDIPSSLGKWVPQQRWWIADTGLMWA
jgi:hypothetical protein